MKLQKNKTIYIDTSNMCTDNVNDMVFIFTRNGYRFITISDTDVEDYAEYFLAIDPVEKICYMDSNASENIATFKQTCRSLLIK